MLDKIIGFELKSTEQIKDNFFIKSILEVYENRLKLRDSEIIIYINPKDKNFQVYVK